MERKIDDRVIMYILQPPTRFLYTYNICVDINIFVSSRRAFVICVQTVSRLIL